MPRFLSMRRLLTSAASVLLLSVSMAMADPASSGAYPQTATNDSAALAPGAPAGEHEASLVSAPGWPAIAAVAIVAIIAVAVSASENSTTVTTR